MKIALLLLAILIAGGMAWIRLAPSDPARWNQPVGAYRELAQGQGNTVYRIGGGAVARVTSEDATPDEALARLDAIARATPRTARLAGSVEEGRITWITRSAIFGFPDYTTAEIRTDGHSASLMLHARQRFGKDDLGVNAARLRDWLSQLAT